MRKGTVMKEILDGSFGERLRTLRIRNGDTQKSLGKKLYVLQETVSYWELGRSYPKVDALITICRMYHTSADYLLGLTDHDLGWKWR